MKVRAGIVHKGGVRASIVRKTILRVLRVLRVYKRALSMGVRAVTVCKGSKTSLWVVLRVVLQVWASLYMSLRVSL